MAEKEQFLKLFLKENKRLFGFIVACVPSFSDAEDILQEVAATLWRKFDTFEEDSNFYGWAKQIAKYEISYYYRQKKKNVWKFDHDVLENIMDINEALDKSSDGRAIALQGCLKKLHESDINLIKLRYQRNMPARKIALDSDVSVSLLYKRLSAIYMMLRKCINRTLLGWDID